MKMKHVTTKWMAMILVIMITGLGLLGFLCFLIIKEEYKLYMKSFLRDRSRSYAVFLAHDFSRDALWHVLGMENGPTTGLCVLTTDGRSWVSAPVAMRERLLAFAKAERKRARSEERSLVRLLEVDGRVYMMASSPIIKGQTLSGMVAMGAELTLLESTLHSFKFMIVLAVAGVLVIVMGVGMVLSWRISRPIIEMGRIAEQLAKGNYHVRVPIKGQDEVAALGRQMNLLAESLLYYQSSRKEFLTHVAHELRTPLTYVKGYAALLRRADLPAEDARRLMGIIYDQSDWLECLVEDLIVLSRLDEGKFALSKQRVDIAPVIHKTLEEMEPFTAEWGIRLERNLVPSVRIQADVNRFRQIIMNLVDNALRYSKPQGKVLVELFRQRGEAVIKVIDEGIGISEVEVNRIWERFYRVEKSRSRKHGGTGLGLPIVKHLVELHGGSIEVESQLGRGTTFVMRFPLADAEEECAS
ncbi:signal transduction histidine kinase [Laceyella sediminis]|uniref:histidine kinase n=3 Tax=Thermoactinomycetaceae TaxID=186824 RepID=A0AA45WJ85_9BACL|nr:signal transduction histidine kinase [Laceyella sediminis]SMP02326.1 Signal transduction histidine kinase [Laceyella tengchongensis]